MSYLREQARAADYAKLSTATAREQAKCCEPAPLHTYTVLYKGSACAYRFLPLSGVVRGTNACAALQTRARPSEGQYILVREDGAVFKYTYETVTTQQFTEVTDF